MIPEMLMRIVYVMYGALLGMMFMYIFARKRTVRQLRGRLLKISETYTLEISDFAGKNVSMDSFCNRLFGPEAYLEPNEHTRKHLHLQLIAIVMFLVLITFVVISATFIK